MLKRITRLLLIVLLLGIAKPALAFGDSGHQMICSLAYQISGEKLRNQLDTLAQQGGYPAFTDGCNWADDVRAMPDFHWSAPLHFINIARGSPSVSAEHCAQQGCILSGISMMQQRLAEDRTDWQALLFLAHLVADLHQPLHVSYADDLGGSRTAVYFLGQPTNLHAVWDFALLHHAGYQNRNQWQALFDRLTAEQKQTWQQGDVLSWAHESAQLTLQIYQHYQAGMLLSEDYVSAHLPQLEQRVLQAAVRLAAILAQLPGDAN